MLIPLFASKADRQQCYHMAKIIVQHCNVSCLIRCKSGPIGGPEGDLAHFFLKLS